MKNSLYVVSYCHLLYEKKVKKMRERLNQIQPWSDVSSRGPCPPSCVKKKDHWGDLRDSFKCSFLKNSAWQTLMSDQKLGRSETHGLYAAFWPWVQLHRGGIKTLAWGEVDGRTGLKGRNKKRGKGNSLDASSSAALAWPFISATCEDEGGNPTGSRMSAGAIKAS